MQNQSTAYTYEKTRLREQEEAQFDRIIEGGHEYASLFLIQSRLTDETAKAEIAARLAKIKSENALVRSILGSHNLSDAVTSLASRQSRADFRQGFLVQQRMLQVQSGAGMSYSFGEIPLPAGKR